MAGLGCVGAGDRCRSDRGCRCGLVQRLVHRLLQVFEIGALVGAVLGAVRRVSVRGDRWCIALSGCGATFASLELGKE